MINEIVFDVNKTQLPLLLTQKKKKQQERKYYLTYETYKSQTEPKVLVQISKEEFKRISKTNNWKTLSTIWNSDDDNATQIAYM